MIRMVVDRFARASAEPWSVEFQIGIAVAAGVALGVLVASGGTVL